MGSGQVGPCPSADGTISAINNNAPPTPAQLLGRPQVEQLTGLSTSSLYRAMRRGKFPEPLRIGARSVRWRSDEVQAWIDGLPRASGTVGAAA